MEILKYDLIITGARVSFFRDGQYWLWCFIQFSGSFVSDPLRLHEQQHTRPPCPSPTPGVHPEPMSIESVTHPTLSFSVVPYSSCPLLLPSIFRSIRVFSNESALCIRWSKCWSFSFSISPSNDYSGLISFRMDWLDLLAVQGTLKSLLQHHSSKKKVAQSSPILCNPMNRSMPGLSVHHQLQEFTQTHVHQVGDAIQPSHPLSSPSPPAPNSSQHQSLFQWVNSSHEVAKVLEFQLQHQSFQWTPRTDLL